MVAFNEEPQKQGGIDVPSMHFPFMSREISNLTPDRSKEFLYQGIGKAMEQGSQLADKTYDMVVTADTRSTIDPMEQDYQKRLQAVDDQMHGSGLDPNSTSLVSQTAQQYGSIPGDLKSFARDGDLWNAAKANGKLSETQHYHNIIDAATKLRNRYPGKRDLIDSEVSRITGVHPANQYVRSLLGDINSFVDAQKAGRAKVETLANQALKDGDLDYSVFKKWQETGDDSIIYKAVAERGAAKWSHQQAMWNHEQKDWSQKDGLDDAKSIATSKVYDAAHNFFDTMYVGSGLNDQHKLDEAIAGMATGKYDYDPEAFATQMNVGIKQAESKLRRDLTTVQPGQKKSLAQYLGPEETEKYIKAFTDELNGWRDAVKHGDLDVATLAARQVKAIQSKGELALFQDKDIGKVATTLKAIKETLGPEAFAVYWQKNQEAWNALSNLNESSEFMKNAEKRLP